MINTTYLLNTNMTTAINVIMLFLLWFLHTNITLPGVCNSVQIFPRVIMINDNQLVSTELHDKWPQMTIVSVADMPD